MKWEEIKAYILPDIVIMAAQIINRFHPKKGFRIDRVKTERYHIRMFLSYGEVDFLLIRPKGFFKIWEMMEKDAIPSSIANEAFDKSCTPERRCQLVSKAIDLKTFW